MRVQTLVGVIPALLAVALPTGDTDRIRRLRKRFARRLEHGDRHEILDWQVRGAGTAARTSSGMSSLCMHRSHRHQRAFLAQGEV